jgi:hypothetical protein
MGIGIAPGIRIGRAVRDRRHHRDGKMALPKGSSTFKAGDAIIAVASLNALKAAPWRTWLPAQTAEEADAAQHLSRIARPQPSPLPGGSH